MIHLIQNWWNTKTRFVVASLCLMTRHACNYWLITLRGKQHEPLMKNCCCCCCCNRKTRWCTTCVWQRWTGVHSSVSTSRATRSPLWSTNSAKKEDHSANTQPLTLRRRLRRSTDFRWRRTATRPPPRCSPLWWPATVAFSANSNRPAAVTCSCVCCCCRSSTFCSGSSTTEWNGISNRSPRVTASSWIVWPEPCSRQWPPQSPLTLLWGRVIIRNPEMVSTSGRCSYWPRVCRRSHCRW